MMEKQFLIIGIDPGTTTAYCAMDMNGNIIKIRSAKELDLSMVINDVIEIGRPLAVGTDKASTPSFVEKFATKTGALLLFPKEDLPVADKRAMLEGYDPSKLAKAMITNSHEMDACASCIFSYNQIKTTVEKIKKFIEENNNKADFSKMTEFVLLKNLNLKTAYNLIHHQDDNANIMREIVEHAKPSTGNMTGNTIEIGDAEKLYAKIRLCENDLQLLRTQNSKLHCAIKERDSIIGRLRTALYNIQKPGRKGKEIIAYKKRQVNSLQFLLDAREDVLDQYKKDVKELNELIGQLNDSVLLKVLDNLGSNEFNEKGGILNISDGDVLYVRNPAVHSMQIINHLKGKIIYIIHEGNVPRSLVQENFVFIPTKHLKLTITKYFGIVSKNSFEKAKHSLEMIEKIIKEHRERF